MRFVSADTGLDVHLPPIPIMPADTQVVEVDPESDTTVTLHDSTVQLAFSGQSLQALRTYAAGKGFSSGESSTVPVSATVFDHISQLPVEQPEMDVFLFCLDLQPHGATFQDSVTVSVANSNNLSAGAAVPITWFNQSTGLWEDVGTGQVTPDGRFITFDITHFSVFHGNTHYGAGSGGPGSNSGGGSPPGNDGWCPTKSGSDIAVTHGNLRLGYTIPGGPAQTNLDVHLSYSTRAAVPRQMLYSSFTDIPVTPTWNTWTVYLPGMKKSWLFYGIDKPTTCAYIHDGTNALGEPLETGLYPYGIRIR